jgi:hypothetical protein
LQPFFSIEIIIFIDGLNIYYGPSQVYNSNKIVISLICIACASTVHVQWVLELVHI